MKGQGMELGQSADTFCLVVHNAESLISHGILNRCNIIQGADACHTKALDDDMNNPVNVCRESRCGS